MKMNRRAVGGFMEAMAAMMVVCIALTSFMGLLAYAQTSADTPELDFEDCILDSTKMVSGEIVFDETGILDRIERYGLGMVSVRIGIHLTSGDTEFFQIYGEEHECYSDGIHCDAGTSVIRCDDGTAYALSYEVGYWYL